MRKALLIGAALLASAPALAEMIESTVSVKVLQVGGQCDVPPDQIITGQGDTFERNLGAPDYVVRGDRFPAQVALGIGLRVRIRGYGAGQPVSVRIVPPVGNTGEWDSRIAADGTFDFGRFPAIGAALPQGRYLLSVLDEGRVLFTYAITIDGEASQSVCVPVS